MLRALASLTATVVLALGLGAAPAHANPHHPDMMLGPGEAGVHGIKDKALVRMSKWGFVYIAGQQGSHLTITHDGTNHTLRYVDTGTKRLGSIPRACTRGKVAKGIAVTCTIPEKFRGKTQFVQVWVRLGNDYVDGHTLGRQFRLWTLADAGRDVVKGGAGNDFVNGAKDGDRVFGNAGNDLLRTGKGNDHLWGGAGKDRLSCAENYDVAYRDAADSMYQCERVR
ncbi:MAG: hypothetical protein U0R80_07815 [Nocardioidaceae bacterium]